MYGKGRSSIIWTRAEFSRFIEQTPVNVPSLYLSYIREEYSAIRVNNVHIEFVTLFPILVYNRYTEFIIVFAAIWEDVSVTPFFFFAERKFASSLSSNLSDNVSVLSFARQYLRYKSVRSAYFRQIPNSPKYMVFSSHIRITSCFLSMVWSDEHHSIATST